MQRLKKRFAPYWQLYVFLLLPVIYFAIFHYIPMAGIQLAFKKFDMKLGIWGSPWIGFDNFTRFISGYMFKRTVINTLRLSIYSLIAGFPFPILFALGLNSITHIRLKKTVQTITYIPHFISTVVIVGMMNQMFHSVVGLYGTVGKAITGVKPPDIFAKADAFMHLYIWSGVWKSFGWSSIIYLAVLTSVNQELLEAAEIDGTNRFQRAVHIDFPTLLPTIIIQLILRMGDLMSIGFEKVFLMQNSLNLRLSEVISTYTYKTGLGGGAAADYSYSTAIDLFNSLIGLVLITTVNQLARKYSETSLW